MSPTRWGPIFFFAAMLALTAARAQGPMQPAGAQTLGQMGSSLGPLPGAPSGGVDLQSSSDGILLGHGGRRVPSSITRPPRLPTVEAINLPARRAVARQPQTRIEVLAIPPELEATAAAGMTLDEAIERLRRENLGLRAKALEIPQAQADVLTAGLRANPFVYADGQLLPYQHYAPVTNPGGPAQYDLNVTLPVDWNLKRRARVAVAQQARTVIAAMYQNAVRMELGNLYNAYVDVLSAQETVRWADAAVEAMNRVVATVQAQKKGSPSAAVEIDQVELQRDTAELGRIDAQSALRSTRRRLATLLNLPPREATQIEVSGALPDRVPTPPPVEELIDLALSTRPDMAAFRLGVSRAQADVLLARANRFSDIYVLYQPFTSQDNHPFGAPASTSWALGATVAVPLWDRNQGVIRRSEINVQQTRLETAALSQIIISQVEDTYDEYVSTRKALQRMETGLLPDARRVLQDNLELYRQGRVTLLSYITAQRDYGDLIRQYRDMLVRHRRSMLDLNTAIGQRILP